jgi:HAD superfamily phosphatase (TIGR01668 family)
MTTPAVTLIPSTHYLLRALHWENMTPDLRVRNIAEIDWQGLDTLSKTRDFRRPPVHLKGCVFDVDGTLCGYHGWEIDPSIEQGVKRAQDFFGNDKICVVSNTNSERRERLERTLGLHVIKCDMRKPHPAPFLGAMSYLGTAPTETVMIGDRLLTDIAGANRLGMYTIKVKSLRLLSEPPHILVARFFENALERFYNE